jgi:hypothetical protein
MGDFFESDENPVGPCIWMDCDKPAVVTMHCRVKPLVMDVCREHADKFMETTISHDDGKKIGLSVAGKMDSPAEIERKKRLN